MRIITKRSRWGHREFIVINRWLDRDGRATSRLAARFLRGSATRGGSTCPSCPSVQLKAPVPDCSRVTLDLYRKRPGGQTRSSRTRRGRGASDRVVRRKRLARRAGCRSYLWVLNADSFRRVRRKMGFARREEREIITEGTANEFRHECLSSEKDGFAECRHTSRKA
jgi:hypothetical protein